MVWFRPMPKIILFPWLFLLCLLVLRIGHIVTWNTSGATVWHIVELVIESFLLGVAVIAIPLRQPWGLTLGALLLFWRVIRGGWGLLGRDVLAENRRGVVLATLVSLILSGLLIVSRVSRKTRPGPRQATPQLSQTLAVQEKRRNRMKVGVQSFCLAVVLAGAGASQAQELTASPDRSVSRRLYRIRKAGQLQGHRCLHARIQ